MPLTNNPYHIVIVTGMSGAGKHTTATALEDLGFFCVDNLQPLFLTKLVKMGNLTKKKVVKLAVVIDIRSGRRLTELQTVYENLKKSGHRVTVVFLDASDEVLANRYRETRRLHPIAGKQGLVESVQAERKQVTSLQNLSDLIIDTTETSVHELNEFIQKNFSGIEKPHKLQVTLVSFGYKYGLPLNADVILDVRFLPNPFFDPFLKPLSGNDPEVKRFFMKNAETKEVIDRFIKLFCFLIPRYQEEGKKYLTVGIGCTGGRHRSVYVCKEIREALLKNKFLANLQHRDIGR